MVAQLKSTRKRVNPETQENANKISELINNNDEPLSDLNLIQQLDIKPLKFQVAAKFGVDTGLFNKFGHKYGKLSLTDKEVRAKDLARFKPGDFVVNSLTGRKGRFQSVAGCEVPTAFVRYEGKTYDEIANPSDLLLAREEPQHLATRVLASPAEATIFDQLKELPKLQPEEISKQLELPLDFTGEDIGKRETLELIKQAVGIRNLIPEFAKYSKNFTRYALVKIDSRNGWRHFHCASFSEFLFTKSALFDKAYSSLQKEWQAGKLETDILQIKIGTLPESQAREFYRLLEQPDDCRNAYCEAIDLAADRDVKLSAKLIREVVNKMLDVEEKPGIKTNCVWVHGSQGSRHYRIKIADFKLDLQDVYQDTAVQLEEISVQQEKSPETLLIEGMLEMIAQQEGTTTAGVIKNDVNFINSNR